MKSTTVLILFALSFLSLPLLAQNEFYSLKLKTLEGKDFALSDLKGKPVLIVNTASECGFTPQLKDLETIHKKYGPQGLVVLAVPSNDFNQEKSTSAEILKVAQSDYKTTFTFLEKQKITGPDKSELFKYLTAQKKNIIFKDVQWNFEKFLIDKNGVVTDRWSSITKPNSDAITKRIEQAISF